jgi:hypothetical protein
MVTVDIGLSSEANGLACVECPLHTDSRVLKIKFGSYNERSGIGAYFKLTMADLFRSFFSHFVA